MYCSKIRLIARRWGWKIEENNLGDFYEEHDWLYLIIRFLEEQKDTFVFFTYFSHLSPSTIGSG